MALHAIMQMNDGQRIEAGRLDVALSKGPLEATYQIVLTGLAKQAYSASSSAISALGLRASNWRHSMMGRMAAPSRCCVRCLGHQLWR